MTPRLSQMTHAYRIYQVRWPVLDGVSGEGLLLEPKSRPIGHVVALPDADQTPEQIVGLTTGVAPEAQFARRLAENGFEVVVPVMIDRTTRWSGHPDIRVTDQSHREWIYRQAFHMGRHVIGYEVQKVLAGGGLVQKETRQHGQGRRGWLRRRRADCALRSSSGHANRRRIGQRLLRLAPARLVGAHLSQRLGAAA